MATVWMQRAGVIAGCVLLVAVSGCGGGGAAGSGDSFTFPSKVLSWNPPSTYSDSTPLDPSRELEAYEIYVNETGSFADSIPPMAEVVAVDPRTGQLATSFDLAKFSRYLSPGVTYRVSVRAVAISGLKSGFSSTAAFSF